MQLAEGDLVRFVAREGQLVWLARVISFESTHVVWGL